MAVSPCFVRGAGAELAPPGPAWALWLLQEGTGQTVVDSSGNNRHLWLGSNANSESSDPSWVVIGGVTCLEFAGAQFCALQGTHSLAQPFTCHILMRRMSLPTSTMAMFGPQGITHVSWVSNSTLVRAFLGSNTIDRGTTINGWNTVNLVGNGTSSRLRVNLGVSATGNAGSAGIGSGMRVGMRASGDLGFIGQIGALAIVPGVGTEADDVLWDTYLRTVKGIPP